MGKLALLRLAAYRLAMADLEMLQAFQHDNECGLQVHDDFYR